MKYCLNCGRAFPHNCIYCNVCLTFLATNEQYYYIQQYSQHKLAAQQYNYQYSSYGANQYPQPDVQNNAEAYAPSKSALLSAQKKKSNRGKRLGYAALALLPVVFVLALLGAMIGGSVQDGSGAAADPTQEQSDEAEIENRIYEILDSTQVIDSFTPTFGQMTVIVFSRFDITYELQPNTTGIYHVTVSGDYCPNPEIPYLTMSGRMVYKIDIESGSCVLISDPGNIKGTFTAYIFSSF